MKNNKKHAICHHLVAYKYLKNFKIFVLLWKPLVGEKNQNARFKHAEPPLDGDE